MLKLLCLDFDGVVVDSLATWVRIVQLAQARLTLGRMPLLDDFRIIHDLSNFGFGRHIGVPEESLLKWEIEIKRASDELAATDPIFPGMVETIIACSQLIPIYIVTSNFEGSVRKQLSEHKLAKFVKQIFAAEYAGATREKLEQAIREVGAASHECLFVGDAKSDIRAGKSASVTTAAVGWGFQEIDILKSELPSYLLQYPADLLKLVENLL